MPNRLFIVIACVALLMAARQSFAGAEARMSQTCDQAARRAALAQDIPLDVLRAITRVETGRAIKGRLEPWPWAINVEGRGHWFRSEQEAKAYVADIFQAGKRSFDIGCFQINYRWHGQAFQSIDAMFDPETNASYAARFLKQLYSELGSWPAAVGAYHSRTPALAKTYSSRYQIVHAQLDPGTAVQTARMSRDPFTQPAAPLFPVQITQFPTGAMGSLMPAADTQTAFIAFN
ncbi:lytic transglycosylase domain-containing protein [Ruegeria faecimaris]|uniref:lytic transglycosylase domain-containing protein n=1 Tax=Ruegeria faecimaris TaxID=686389 RepID=UPI0024937952|nr:lytic transglycosylase domain-containing protein [Ruegeria faecimaris]